MPKISDMHERWMQDPSYRKEYAELEEEFKGKGAGMRYWLVKVEGTGPARVSFLEEYSDVDEANSVRDRLQAKSLDEAKTMGQCRFGVRPKPLWAEKLGLDSFDGTISESEWKAGPRAKLEEQGVGSPES